MESFGSILEGDWSSLNAMYSTEESDFMAQLINYCSITNDYIYNSVDHFSLGNTCFYPTSGPDSYYAGNFDKILVTNDDIVFCDEEITKEENPSLVQISSNADINGSIYMQLGQEDQLPNLESHKEVVLANSVQKSKKRSTNSGDKNQRNVKAKKHQKLTTTGCMKNKERNGTAQKQSLSSCSSENEYNEPTAVPSDSLDSKEATTVNSIAELRAVRGSATDSQSLYARKRRERINERLRTLQNLVPNGTKVDISTMLEDAVQYVKFLQLQIKLLSSDDKWMYAPIAYNGIDLGLDSNISPQLYR